MYNLKWKTISTLTNGYLDAGTYTLRWDATDVASRVQFIKADTVGFTKIQKN